MIDMYLITGIIFALGITAVFAFMVSAKISQNRTVKADHIDNG